MTAVDPTTVTDPWCAAIISQIRAAGAFFLAAVRYRVGSQAHP